jgi:hypothetical protein
MRDLAPLPHEDALGAALGSPLHARVLGVTQERLQRRAAVAAEQVHRAVLDRRDRLLPDMLNVSTHRSVTVETTPSSPEVRGQRVELIGVGSSAEST